ncbi:MAG: orotidine-5'-phosphate decarboxylase [Candidatus Omnitrophota bacterium]
MKQKPKIIVALDVDTFAKAKYFVDKLYPEIKIFKVGSQLFTSCGPKIVEYINRKGAEVFLDLKFFDIPNTVANAVRQAVRLKVKMLTLHVSGGREMIFAAAKSAKNESRKLKLKRPLLIGVTVLTSQQADPQEVLDLARLGLDCGLDGVVCSVRETETLRRGIKKKFLIVTPGIRQDTKTVDDQKRTATASEAAAAGSNFLVIGRPVLEAVNPKEVIRNLFKNNM